MYNAGDGEILRIIGQIQQVMRALQFIDCSNNRSMNVDVAKPEAKTGNKAPLRATGPGSGPPKFKQRNSRQFKSKPPKRGVIGFGEEIPGMEWLGTDFTVICPWEAYSHLELHELAQYGII
ncbi:retinal cone rhodopsin-sensitive cGMP 3',5'-cyclic phosphodiesterase subunit gamma-like isoform X2 [Siniperca chuatsi]|uniref:retinal cone rhodopsin-sensitive cGMP 3',5'-cyclic phosphodiesterase subunit gamma-like isoform X2 n=1 Tax=Siniperca chuatsi TaxID=119488 RepID=UPI001CE0CE0C|nr:retinal cone rhodopsin-sensitive cGMP 3',5'-cyclic phosphodiesterase subunit gamma-like isoform X2 [Siniperca chuatsi]